MEENISLANAFQGKFDNNYVNRSRSPCPESRGREKVWGGGTAASSFSWDHTKSVGVAFRAASNIRSCGVATSALGWSHPHRLLCRPLGSPMQVGICSCLYFYNLDTSYTVYPFGSCRGGRCYTPFIDEYGIDYAEQSGLLRRGIGLRSSTPRPTPESDRKK